MEIGNASVGFLMMFAWIVPLGSLLVTLWLGLRFVRAAERVADAMERRARADSSSQP